MMRVTIVGCIALLAIGASVLPVSAETIVIDTVVATVDEKPITLRDLTARLPNKRKLTLAEAAEDTEAKSVLDRMIFEEILINEAAQRKIVVPDEDIERYMDEVARRNNFSREELLQAVAAQGKDPARYRDDIRIEILQGRVASSYLRNSTTVTKEDVDEFVKAHPEIANNEVRVVLRRIIVETANRTREEAESRIMEAIVKLDEGQPFSEIARSYSDGPEAAEGGSLGALRLSDLSEDIREAVAELSEGERSPVITSADGFQIVALEGKVGGGETDEQAMLARVKEHLQQEKMQSKAQSLFSSELYKNHTIDKKI